MTSLSPAPSAKNFMEVLREAEKVEQSTNVGSLVFRRKPAIKVVVAHAVDLIHHHDIVLESGNCVLLHGAKEVQVDPPAVAGAGAGVP